MVATNRFDQDKETFATPRALLGPQCLIVRLKCLVKEGARFQQSGVQTPGLEEPGQLGQNLRWRRDMQLLFKRGGKISGLNEGQHNFESV